MTPTCEQINIIGANPPLWYLIDKFVCTHVGSNVNLLPLGEEGADDADVSVASSRVDAARSVLVGHLQVDAFFEQHRGAVGVAVQGGDVHQGAAVLGALPDGRFELVHQRLDDARVASFGRQMHWRPICQFFV